MGIGATAGTRLYIAPPGTPILSGYTEIKNIANLGDVAQQFNTINVEEVNTAFTYDLKGTQNFPNFAITLNRNNADPGQQALRVAAAQRDVLYNFRLEESDGGIATGITATITIASPGVITAVAHGRAIGDRVSLSTTGLLPTGLVAGTTYYVLTAPTADTMTVSTTFGGSAVVTTGTQSGVHTLTPQPMGTITVWKGEAFGYGTSYGGPNVLKQVRTSISIRPDSVILTPSAASLI